MDGALGGRLAALVGLAGLSVHLALTAASWAQLAMHGISGCRRVGFAFWAQAKLRALQRQVVRWRCGKDDDAGHHIARRQMRSLCVERARTGFTMLRMALALLMVALVHNRLSTDYVLMAASRPFVFVSMYVVVLAMRAWPCLLNERTSDYWYVLINTLQIASWWLIEGVEEFGESSMMISLITSFGCSRTSLVLVLNLSMGLCRAIVFTRVSETGMNTLFSSNFNTLASEVFGSLAVVALAHQFHAQAFVVSYRNVTERALRHERAAMTRLLELMSEVVLEMDSDLRISQESPKLTAMLTLGSSVSVLNTKLEEWMPLASDQANLQNLAKGLLQDEALPSAMHATMRGPGNTLLQVELLFDIFPSIDGAKRFLVGIREVTETPIPELQSQDTQRRVNASATAPPSESGSSQRSGRMRRKGRRGTPPASPRQSLGGAGDELSTGTPSESGSSQRSGRKRRKGLRGTPPASPRQPLGGADDEFSTETQDTLLDTRFQETSQMGKELSLFSTIQFWNVPVSTASCCALHGYLAEVVACCSKLATRRCATAFRPTGDAQCQECGMLTEWSEDRGLDGNQGAARECDVCFAKAVCRPKAAPQVLIQSL